MRKHLEQEMLADSLKGRVRYGCTTYTGMDGCHIFELCIDGRQTKRFSWETVNTYFIENGCKKNKSSIGASEYWAEFLPLLEQYPINSRTEYTDQEFCEALEQYRNQDIRQSIHSENPLVIMFAIFDRRVGKRTISALKDTMETHPEWLRQLYQVRVAAENISH